jgi:hypothetical protein
MLCFHCASAFFLPLLVIPIFPHNLFLHIPMTTLLRASPVISFPPHPISFQLIYNFLLNVLNPFRTSMFVGREPFCPCFLDTCTTGLHFQCVDLLLLFRCRFSSLCQFPNTYARRGKGLRVANLVVSYFVRNTFLCGRSIHSTRE